MPEPVAADASAIAAHLDWLTRRWPELNEPCDLELRALGEGITPQSARFPLHRLDEAVDWAVSMNRLRGRNIYPVVNPLRPWQGRDATDADVIASFVHWADADAETAISNLRSWAGPKWRALVRTGTIPHDRVHVYWELADPIRDMIAWRETQRAIAARLASDGAVINPSRIMRLGGTISWPGEKKQARGYVSELATFRLWPERELLDGAAVARAFAGAAAQTQQAAGAFTFDAGAQSRLDREAAAQAALAGQDWHGHVIRLVASYVAKGLDDEEIHALTAGLTLAGYTPDQTRREVQVAIDGARRKGWTPEPAYANSAAIAPQPAPDASASPLEWFDDIEPALSDSYIVKGLMSDGAMTVLYGASNSGKTFFALDLAYHIAAGMPWRGRRVNGGGVLYLAAEGGRGIANRIAALRQSHGLCDVPLALRRAGLDLLKSDADLRAVVQLSGEVAARAPLKLIVVDTLSRVMAGGDENAPQDMTALIRNIDAIRAATGAHVLLIHHSGKDESRGARGHSSLRAAVDTEIEVSSGDEGRAAIVRKQREYQGNETFAFDLVNVPLGVDQDGDPVETCIVKAADAEEYAAARATKKGLGGNQKIIADTFDQMLADGLGRPNPGGVGMPDPGRFWCVPMDELRRLARGKMASTDTRSAFNQAFAALSGERGLMGAGEMLVWRIDRKCAK